MLTFISFVFVLLTARLHCQSIPVQFQQFPVNTDIGYCTCDLMISRCDTYCCCDPDCSSSDRVAFNCSDKSNIYTNLTAPISTVQNLCYKNISIFTSNSPYVIQKMGELVCIDIQRYSGSQYYQQPNIQNLDANSFVRTLNTENNVLTATAVVQNRQYYLTGDPILYATATNTTPFYFTVPSKAFNSPWCSGSLSITYMNNFTSTCNQFVTDTTCANELNPATYLNQSCFLRFPKVSSDNSSYYCLSSSFTPSTPGSTCNNALKSLTINIFYTNPSGITYVNATPVYVNQARSTIFEQTFIVQFIKNTPTPISSSTARNPGYLQGANIIGAIINSTTISVLDSSKFSILKPTSSGSCDVTSRTPISFGENIRTTCKYSPSSAACPTSLNTLFMNIDSASLYVAAYSNPDLTNSTYDWLPVRTCTSDIGSSGTYDCSQQGVPLSLVDGSNCYTKLDIQIAYTKIGTLTNPQFVLSGVIFHYQKQSSLSASTPILFMESVTFQDITAPSVIEQGAIPVPDVRLPADFFYPFSSSDATKSMTYSLFLVSLLVFCLFSCK